MIIAGLYKSDGLVCGSTTSRLPAELWILSRVYWSSDMLLTNLTKERSTKLQHELYGLAVFTADRVGNVYCIRKRGIFTALRVGNTVTRCLPCARCWQPAFKRLAIWYLTAYLYCLFCTHLANNTNSEFYRCCACGERWNILFFRLLKLIRKIELSK